MNDEEISRMTKALWMDGFVEVSNEPEIIDDPEWRKFVQYTDDKITVYSATSTTPKDWGIRLIEYDGKYYTGINKLDYIIMDFYRKIIHRNEP